MCAHVGEKLAGQDASSGVQPMDIGQIDKSEGEDEDVSAVQQRRPHDRPNHKYKRESDNDENRSTVRLPIRYHRHQGNRLHETRNLGAMKRNRVRARRGVSFVTGVVERAIPPDSARQEMIVRT